MTVAVPFNADAPIIDTQTGCLTPYGMRFMLTIWTRTGGAVGITPPALVPHQSTSTDTGSLSFFVDTPADTIDLSRSDLALLMHEPAEVGLDAGSAALAAFMIGNVV